MAGYWPVNAPETCGWGARPRPSTPRWRSRAAASAAGGEDEEAPPHVPICDEPNKYQRMSLPDGLASVAWDAPDMPQHHTSRRGVTNKVQLSTYADCIGNNMSDLMSFLQTEVRGEGGPGHAADKTPVSTSQ